MSEAPERIWFCWDDEFDVGFVNTNGDKGDTPDDAQEYVRADRIEELEAKLAKAVRLMELSVELATWNTTLLDDVIYFITELKGDKP
jgi:hypothetical protein